MGDRARRLFGAVLTQQGCRGGIRQEELTEAGVSSAGPRAPDRGREKSVIQYPALLRDLELLVSPLPVGIGIAAALDL